MPLFSIGAVHSEFGDAQNRTSTFLSTAQDLRRPDGKAIPVRDVEEITGLALLKLTLAWESFVEDTFLRYICGARSARGLAPTLLIPKESSLKAALNALRGNQRYLSWTRCAIRFRTVPISSRSTLAPPRAAA
jgi:hypothetical protein